MRLPGGIGLRLALALLGVVGGALLVAYVIVVPSLEKRLVGAKLDGLERAARPLALFGLPQNQFEWGDWASGAAVATNARVVVLREISQNPPALVTYSDSSNVESTELAADSVALSALSRSVASPGHAGVARGRVDHRGVDYAEVAVARPDGVVVLLSSSLADSRATVRLVQRRLAYATAAAVAIALLLGSVATALHARRIRRLERAAERIAEGSFDEPVVDPGDDELGELARAFERMRVQLSRVDDARKAFVANASHELRTPLFALGGFIELLEDEDLDEETRRGFLATMHEQVERLAKLATDLLDLSRMDAGALRIEREEFDLADSARAVAEELHGLAEGRGHELDVDLDGRVWVAADEERVLQIGRALAGNAVLHTPPGTRVVLRARQSPGRGWLEVEDDGPGIAAEQLPRVFDRFYRVETGSAPGSGLGLAIARELAELMGGSLRASSRPGRTTFVLDLPVGTSQEPTPSAPA